MRILAIGSQALMDGFALLGVETHTDISVHELELLLNNIVRQQDRTLIYLQQDLANTDLPVLQRLREEGGNVLISELPSLHEPDNRQALIDALIAKVIGPSALEKTNE